MLCPHCHRPSEDSEVSLCCAEAGVQWRCTDCGQSSVGFAFPYGRCPRCGGPLALRDPDRAGQAEALAAVRTAFEIELGGRAFYQRAAADTADSGLRELFRRFAALEGEHMETLARRYHVEVPDPSPGFRLETAAIFAEAALRPLDPASLFEIALALEQRAAAFFAERAQLAPVGSPERRLYDELAAEEREHALTLAHEHARWYQRQPGLLSVEPAPTVHDAETMNGAELLLAGHPPDHVALECDGRQMRYGELRDRVARAAAVWRQRGLRPGDRVAIKLPDSFDWVVAWLGALWAGGVAVGVNPRIAASEWQYILEEAGFDVIVAESAQDTPAPWRTRVVEVDAGRRAVAAAQPAPALRLPPQAPAFWVHSSGTSGKPKAVVHAQRCLLEIGRIASERLGIGPTDRLFASSRLFFAYPLTNLLLAGLRIGATLILDAQWPNARSVAATAAATHPSVLFSVPSLYRDLLRESLAAPLAAAGVRCCISAGEALPASLREAWRAATGLPMIDGYGASEVLVLVLTAVDGDDALRPSPGVDVRPLDPQAAAQAAPTRLLIRAPTQALGYLDRPAAQADSFRDGAFCPADLFVATADGGWRFAGRDDSLIKIRGRWVNLIELEERLGTGLPGLREGAAVCIPDADGVESVAYFFAAADGDRAALRHALDERIAGLPHYQRPAQLHALEALPRTATGKLLRRRLLELSRSLA